VNLDAAVSQREQALLAQLTQGFRVAASLGIPAVPNPTTLALRKVRHRQDRVHGADIAQLGASGRARPGCAPWPDAATGQAGR